MPYVSITGLSLKSPLQAPAFWWHAVRAMGQARATPGLIRAEARRIGGVHHTLTLWESREAMRAYLTTGAHLAAMKAFHRLATGATIGFDCDIPPDWGEVPEIYATRARSVASPQARFPTK